MFRENFYDVLTSIKENVDLVVVPKNTGLKGYAWKTLKEAGFNLKTAKKVSDTQLEKNGLAVLLRRGEDIPLVVEEERAAGRFAVGVTGDDLFDEYRLRNPGNMLFLANTYDWDDKKAEFRRPTLCLMSRNGIVPEAPAQIRVGIAARYEYTGRLYLSKDNLVNGFLMEIKKYDGNVEDAVIRGYVDMCIDVVYTGETRRSKGLEVIQKYRSSDLSIITPSSAKLLEDMAREIPLGPSIDRRQIGTNYIYLNRNRVNYLNQNRM